jgi:hypothetical protein
MRDSAAIMVENRYLVGRAVAGRNRGSATGYGCGYRPYFRSGEQIFVAAVDFAGQDGLTISEIIRKYR